LKLQLLLLICVAALVAVPAGLVVADNGPHGGFSAATDACAGCHRTHTATMAKLLTEHNPSLCYDCHGTAGTGADTNVADGMYLARSGDSGSLTEGVAGRGLKGGGFTNALMATSYAAVTSPSGTTSSHSVDGSSVTAWGNGLIGSGPGSTIALTCTSCHDPHGKASSTHTATYRLLRTAALEAGSTAINVDVTDEVAKTYTVVSSTNAYIGQPYSGPGLIAPTPIPGRSAIVPSRALDLTYWCTNCHTRYMAPAGSYKTDSGDADFAYRHRTVGSATSTQCLRCHVAHGSSANMGAFAGSVPWPDHAVSPSGSARSSLLRLDNRGVCQNCHNKK